MLHYKFTFRWTNTVQCVIIVIDDWSIGYYPSIIKHFKSENVKSAELLYFNVTLYILVVKYQTYYIILI